MMQSLKAGTLFKEEREKAGVAEGGEELQRFWPLQRKADLRSWWTL